MNAQSANPSVNDIKHDIMKYYHQLPVTKENSKAVRAAAWALLANVLVSDYLNRWNEASAEGKPCDDLLTDADNAVGKALQLDDTFALAHYAAGLVHRAKSSGEDEDAERKQALKAFDKAINWDSTFARAYAQKGSELINKGEFAKALVWIDKAIACGPNDPSAGMFYWNRGRAFFFQKKYRKAIEPLRKAVELRSNLWHSQLYLASAYVKNNDLDQAKAEVKRFLKKNPDFTITKVVDYEKGNPSTYLKEGRKIFHEALKTAEMPA
jgi:adenylate cyclase